MSRWEEAVQAVQLPDETAAEQMRERIGQLTKPPGSLGRLETLAVDMAAVQGTIDLHVRPPAVLVFAGDHGVTAENVSAYDASLTRLMLENFTRGGAAVNVLASEIGASVTVYDIGCAGAPVAGTEQIRIRRGTGNIRVEAAMTKEECSEALDAGCDAVKRAVEGGAAVIIPGEMGIGNTTAAAAVSAKLLDLSARDVTGVGTGLSGEDLRHKEAVVEDAVKRSDKTDPSAVIQDLGGLEIAAMTGAVLEAAASRKVILVDGFIATTAALAAVHMAPWVRPFLFFGHQSEEAGHRALLDALDADPILSLGMRLGEGSGAVCAFPVLRMAARIPREMAVFSDLGL
ncbi:nicotinate-nucleotide--dimethylbenzimidazole phosphoribosyltransferase [Alkalicoccus urumqiensis]|uniref:Nicotinate-nucleotide--dimethylbenzimidazole phosphoribosyltransferase n=1 Tax=Alkalicoccus urumqiensis TaxID=1548213 RepID=A0A2P6MI85_ALKUR|nr:nicotinate-nucleotide--dimethylbenzimidazole phosphoribosyltransferase [Alkalicoccus urumqiensis]PRO66005.1 nicotinate-nucleotide--dimethylbenzimidazole phosphoribosyltransferase [Alkalicoccus urumqiensis]